MTDSYRLNKQIILRCLFVLIICLSNFWIYQIYKYNFLIGELLVIETILLFLSLYIKKRIILVLVGTILLTLGVYLLTNHFDKNAFSISTVESIRIAERKQFYANELGKIYRNKIGILYFDTLRLYSNKLSSNFFSALDLDLYFSPHSVIENEKYPLFLAPFFILGFLVLLITTNKHISITYSLLALFMNSFINLDSKLGPLLMFPFISLCIALGLIKSIEVVRSKYKKNI